VSKPRKLSPLRFERLAFSVTYLFLMPLRISILPVSVKSFFDEQLVLTSNRQNHTFREPVELLTFEGSDTHLF
jgi:hypothetical protein